jgi:hypothetical protein
MGAALPLPRFLLRRSCWLGVLLALQMGALLTKTVVSISTPSSTFLPGVIRFVQLVDVSGGIVSTGADWGELGCAQR